MLIYIETSISIFHGQLLAASEFDILQGDSTCDVSADVANKPAVFSFVQNSDRQPVLQASWNVVMNLQIRYIDLEDPGALPLPSVRRTVSIIDFSVKKVSKAAGAGIPAAADFSLNLVCARSRQAGPVIDFIPSVAQLRLW